MQPKQSTPGTHITRHPHTQAPRRRALRRRLWALLLLSVCLGGGWHSIAQQRGPHIVWTSKPSQLQRGSTFVCKGRVVGASEARRKAGLHVSLSMVHNKKKVSLGRASVDASGAFVLRGAVPAHIAPRGHRILVSIWGRPVAGSRTPPTKPTNRPQQPKGKKGAKGAKGPKGSKGSKGAKGKKGAKGTKGAGDRQGVKGREGTKAPKAPKEPGGAKGQGKKGVPGESKKPGTSQAAPGQNVPPPGPGQARQSKLRKQLQKGWGPGATKDAQRQRKKIERQRRKTRFLLPPIGRMAPAPSPGPSQSFPRPGQGQTPKRPPQQNQPPGQGASPKPAPSPGINQFPGQGQGRRQGQRQGQSPRGARQGQQPGQGQPGQGDRRPRRGAGPQHNPDLQTGTPGAQGPPSAANPKGPPIMMPSQRQRPTRRPPPPGGGGDNRLWSQANNSNLDLRTKGGHTYLRQVFTPYMPQHQRITAFDHVKVGYRLVMSSARKRRISVGGRRSTKRSYFVGRVRILLFPGRWTPIPSVAPDARILWYRTIPEVRLSFAKDRGDIVFVRSQAQRTQSIYLEFGTDADKAYFGGPVPAGIRASHYRRSRRPRLHPRIETAVRRHMHRMGLHSRMDLRAKLSKIIPFLRSFVARPLRASEHTGDAYLTLLKARAGVCRHRAMLFTVTMRSLGYPARFVANNAHAFAEIQYPNGRWRQVDLGGGDLPHYMGSWRGPKFKPPKDPFPRPPPSARTNAPDPMQQKRQQPNPHPPPHGAGTGAGGHHAAPPVKRRKRRKKRRDYVSHSRLQ